MPYIPQDQRSEIDWELDCLLDELDLLMSRYPDKQAGILNYTISYIISKILKGNLNYANINMVVGVLECAKLELYRRLAGPYEDKAIAKNGDLECYKNPQ